MTAKIHIERMMHRNSIQVQGETAATYALIKLIPSGGAGGDKPIGLNLALCLDVSGSMYEEDGTGISRLKRVQDAAINSIDKLNPDDSLAIVAFAHNALTLLPATKLTERSKIEDVIRRIDMFDVDPGGTSMDDGMQLAIAEVEKLSSTGRLSQVLVLTDGETSGEQNCRTLAQDAARKKIHMTMMGVGVDWKASLIKDLAKLSEGKWYYIDVNKKEDAERIFVE
jgi:Ca-activated chloride channel family protein